MFALCLEIRMIDAHIHGVLTSPSTRCFQMYLSIQIRRTVRYMQCVGLQSASVITMLQRRTSEVDNGDERLREGIRCRKKAEPMICIIKEAISNGNASFGFLVTRVSCCERRDLDGAYYCAIAESGRVWYCKGIILIIFCLESPFWWFGQSWSSLVNHANFYEERCLHRMSRPRGGDRTFVEISRGRNPLQARLVLRNLSLSFSTWNQLGKLGERSFPSGWCPSHVGY